MQTENEVTVLDELSLDLWEQMSAEGIDVPIEMPSHGISMYPLLHAKGDSIRILPVRRDLVLGDIVVFHRDDGKQVAHRVCKVLGNQIQTLGDNCKGCDKPVDQAVIFGLVTHVRRKGKIICVDTPGWRRYGRFMTITNPFRMFIKINIYYPLVRFAKKILGRK